MAYPRINPHNNRMENPYGNRQQPNHRHRRIPRHIPDPNSMFQFLRRFHPIRWQGALSFRQILVAVQMHIIFGSQEILQDCLRSSGRNATLIVEQIRIEEAQINHLLFTMRAGPANYCTLLALPCGTSYADVFRNNTIMQNSFVRYLQRRNLTGVIHLQGRLPDTPYIMRIFPNYTLFNDRVRTDAPNLHRRLQDFPASYLFITITRATVVEVNAPRTVRNVFFPPIFFHLRNNQRNNNNNANDCTIS